MRARAFCLAFFALGLFACPDGNTVKEPEGKDAGGDSKVDAMAPVSCTNGVKDGNETDIDCGGSCGPCDEGKLCAQGAECKEKVCKDGRCATPTAYDGVQNGTESDVDCGGASGKLCAAPKHCNVASDCLSNECEAGACKVSDGDGIRNGTETDIDCGGAAAPKCTDGKRCAVAGDCESLVCVGKICQKASHADEVKNLDETGVDCGGPDPTAARCAVGQTCVTSSDCALNSCNRNTKICQQPAINGVQDGTETDIDCGGDSAPPCDDAKKCLAGADCKSFVCSGAKLCSPASKTDGVKNGDESDIDCGGTTTGAPKCAVGKSCNTMTDCGSDSCNYNKKCTEYKSCAPHFGGDTCGAGEVGNAGAQHESCCKTIPLNGTTRLDKYAITAGRIREFISRTNGDARSWIQAHPTAQIPPALYPYLPDGMEGQYGAYQQVGNTVFFSDRPCPGCGQGCWVGPQAQNAYGHNNFWWDDATQQARYGAIPRAFTKEQLDVKTMNCITQVMLAAFCAWDGGRLATAAELLEAWGPDAYPWGNSPAYSDFNAKYTNWNPWSTTLFSNPPFRYQFPLAQNPAQTDQSFAIAAPGRFVNDKHAMNGDAFMDLAGNIIQITATIYNNDDAAHLNLPTAGWVGGSWEGHWGGRGTWGPYNVLTKYGKAGGRCARPL
ncbi:MAG: hypothetical protein U0174_19980 [Polyangiaceae bacterium]